MGESVMKPFALLIVFIGVTIVLLGTLSDMQASNMITGLDNPDTGVRALAGWNYTMKEPDNGFAITWADVETSLEVTWHDGANPDPDASHKIFYAPGGASTDRGSIWAYIIRNNSWDNYWHVSEPPEIRANEHTEDMIVFAQKYAMHGWFDIKTGVNWRYAVLPFSYIHEKSQNNMSAVSFLLGNDNMTAFIMSANSSMTFYENLYTNNSFTLAIGQTWGMEGTVGKASMWKLVGQLLTCSLPETNYYANLIMTICIWAVIAFVALKMISAFIPTIPGL